MSLLTNVHAENKSERRLSVFIFNLIIFVMSFFILVVYATQPFLKVQAQAELTKEKLVELVDFGNEDVNVAELLSDEGIKLELEIVVPADLMLDTAAKVLNRIIFYFNTDVDLTDVSTALIDENVDLLVDQLLPTLEDLALRAAKQIAATKAKDALLSKLTEGDETKNAEFEEKLENAGIDDAYLEGKMDAITDSLQAEGATPETVADTVIGVMDEILADMQTKEDTDLHIDEVNETELRQQIVESLESFTNKEDGTIDLDGAIAELFNKMLSGSEEETAQSNSEVALLSVAVNDEQTDSVSELKLNVRNTILELLGENVHTSVANGLKIASLVLVFSMFTWVYLMIKIIVKMFTKDNTVRFKLPILFGGIPGLLWLVPSVAMHFLSKNPALMANPYNLQLSVASSGWFAILGVVVLLIISAPYGALRKALRGKKLKLFK